MSFHTATLLTLKRFWIGTITLFLLGTLMAQETTTLSVNVKVVNVLATVRDKHGNIVNTLTKDDFVLEEDGRPQTIRYFARETDLPLSLGLLVDTSLSQLNVLDQEKTASRAFANEVLREGQDKAFLIHFDHEVELLRDLTSSREKFSSSLDQLQAPDYSEMRRSSGGGGNYHGHGRRGGGGGGGTLLYDSIFLASDEVLQNQHGRKAIVVLTDGVDHGSKVSLDRAIESAQRADTMVYSIYYEGMEGGAFQRGMSGPWGGGRRGGGWPGGGGGWPGGGYPGGRTDRASSENGKKILQRLSEETGGRMFVVSKKDPIDQIYKKIEDELRNQYNLGYSPDRSAENGPDYRHIKVITKEKDLTVQAREGYYASRQINTNQGN
jgi:VWFA-related protein